MKESKIIHQKTTAYHPRSNGLVERANREIKRYLRKYINHEQNDWETWLPTMKYVLNTRLGEGMDYTSYQIVYGETPEITTKKKMVKKNNERVTERQARREDERGHPVPNYEKGQ